MIISTKLLAKSIEQGDYSIIPDIRQNFSRSDAKLVKRMENE